MLVDCRTCSIFAVDAQAYISPVNCVGISGLGLALQFKKEFPTNHKAYEKHCFALNMKPGDVFVHSLDWLEDHPKYIVNFATKAHWKNNSKIEWIETGMTNLVKWIEEAKIESIALPMLGCGAGGLDWQRDVQPVVAKALDASKSNCVVSLMVR